MDQLRQDLKLLILLQPKSQWTCMRKLRHTSTSTGACLFRPLAHNPCRTDFVLQNLALASRWGIRCLLHLIQLSSSMWTCVFHRSSRWQFQLDCLCIGWHDKGQWGSILGLQGKFGTVVDCNLGCISKFHPFKNILRSTRFLISFIDCDVEFACHSTVQHYLYQMIGTKYDTLQNIPVGVPER